MGLTETVFGKPPETTINQTPAMKPPGFSFARDFFNSLGNIAQNPYPTFPGQLDPGLSPTMQEMIRRSQGYAGSGPPEILAGVQGSLGRFMNPSFINPAFRAPMGAPDYANQNPNQRIFGGGTVGQAGGAFGAPGAMGPSFPPKAPGGMPGGGPPVAFGGPPPGGGMGGPPPPNAFKGGNPSFNFMDAMMDPSTGQAVGRGPDNQFPAGAPGGGPAILPPGPQAQMGGLSRENPGMPMGIEPWMMGPPNSMTKPMPTGGPPGIPPSFGGDSPLPTTHVGGPPQSGQGQTFGGYSVEQLLSDPALVRRLGARGLQRWNQSQRGGIHQAPQPPPSFIGAAY